MVISWHLLDVASNALEIFVRPHHQRLRRAEERKVILFTELILGALDKPLLSYHLNS
jgi:hypothetical protein